MLPGEQPSYSCDSGGINRLQEGPEVVGDEEPDAAMRKILIQKESQLKEIHVKEQLTANESDNL